MIILFIVPKLIRKKGSAYVMAKSRVKEWSKPEKLIQLRGWKMDGLTDQQVANNIGITRRTLDRWKLKSRPICRMLRVGKTIANYSVENALFKKAMHGNTACIIFWLKNNFSRKYSDTQDSYMESKLKHARINQIKSNIRKTNAEAKIKEILAKQNDTNNNQTISKIDDLMKQIFGNNKK